jgi:mannosyltransferase OCH1-like enzyme
MAIAPVVHRIWFGDVPFPDEYVRYGKAWETLGYKTRLWRETDLPVLVNQDEYEQIGRRGVNTGIAPQHLGVVTQRADLVSYELVRLYGGIYANCDIEPLRELPLDGVTAFAGWEVQGAVICNALFGAEPHHPFVEACVNLLPHRFRSPADYPTMQLQTGPGLITAAYTVCQDDVKVFDQQQLYPYGFQEMTPDVEAACYPDAFTAHHWGHRKVEGWA